MLFRKKLIPFKVEIEYEYITKDYGVDIVTRYATEIEFAKTKQQVYRRLKKKFKNSNILDLKVTELE